MSENQKCLNLIRGGGGQQFSKMSEIQKSLKFPMGRGGQAYLGIFPKFFRFFFMMAPLSYFKLSKIILVRLIRLGEPS